MAEETTAPVGDLPDRALELHSLVTAEGTVEISLEEVEVPRPGADQVVVRVEACPVNPSDLGLLFGGADMTAAIATGTPGRPVVTAPIPEAAMRGVAARVGISMPVGNTVPTGAIGTWSPTPKFHAPQTIFSSPRPAFTVMLLTLSAPGMGAISSTLATSTSSSPSPTRSTPSTTRPRSDSVSASAVTSCSNGAKSFNQDSGTLIRGTSPHENYCNHTSCRDLYRDGHPSSDPSCTAQSSTAWQASSYLSHPPVVVLL